MREVAIVAAGMTRFGELWKSSLRDLFVEAATQCLDNGGVKEVDSIFIGNMSAGQFVGQEHLVERLQAASVVVSVAGNRVRVSPAIYNTDDDVGRLVDALEI